MSRLLELDRRREVLLARSAQLRSGLAQCARELTGQLSFADVTARFLRGGGGVLVGCAAALVLFRGRRRALRLASRVAMLWPLLRPWLPRLWVRLRERART